MAQGEKQEEYVSRRWFGVECDSFFTVPFGTHAWPPNWCMLIRFMVATQTARVKKCRSQTVRKDPGLAVDFLATSARLQLRCVPRCSFDIRLIAFTSFCSP